MYLFLMLIQLVDRKGFRWMAKLVIQAAYFLKKGWFVPASFNEELKLWEYRIGSSYFVTKTASWFCSDEYYMNTLKKYSCFYYLPKTNEVVIDVGAGVGEEAIPLARCVGANGKIFAIEANPNTFKVLQKVIKENNFSSVLPLHLAIAEKNGEVLIEDDEAYGVANSLQGSGRSITVPSITFDEFVKDQNLSRIDLLKVNIEGAEKFLIRGMKESISIVQNIAISCHDFRASSGESDFFRTRDEVISYLGLYFDLKFQQSGDPVRDNYVYGVNRQLQ